MNSFISKYFFYYPVTLLSGERVGKYLDIYKNSQYWSFNDLAHYQEVQLKKLLIEAYTAPFYYGRYDLDSLLKLKGKDFLKAFRDSVPVLEKQDLIKFQNELRTKKSGRTSLKTTGGSTGEPVTVYKNSLGLTCERAATWRAYEWAGISIGDKQARFWGVPHSKKNRIKAGLIDFVANRQRFSAFDLDEVALANITSKIIRFKPRYLYGYVSAIRTLAEYVLARNEPDEWPFSVIITTSEVLTNKDRDIIRQAFHKPVFNEYGCGEVGSIAHECQEGNLHIMAENIYLEQDVSGELIITDLHNQVMPLIRYKVGDFATLSDENCKCGVTLPILKNIGGRAYDLIETPEGRKIHPESVIYIFEELQRELGCFKQFQVVQSGHELLVNLVPEGVWNSDNEKRIKHELLNKISSGMIIKVNQTKSISRERSGKMRVVKVIR